MIDAIRVCGRQFAPELILHLQELLSAEPAPRIKVVAHEVCELLAWRSPCGRPALSSARVALHKLERRGLLRLPKGRTPLHRLRRSVLPLPPLVEVPGRVDQVQGLHLYRISDQSDPLHALWNDLIIDQHPCGDDPLVGGQLRYLVLSDHGCLGAVGFGPAAFQLAARDAWIGWSKSARLANLKRVIGLSRFLIRQEVRCANLSSKVYRLILQRLPTDWKERYQVEPVLVETFVDRSSFTGRSLGASNWMRIGQSRGRGRLGPQEPSQTVKDIWIFPLDRQARSQLQKEQPPVLTPRSVLCSLEQDQWCERELSGLELGDQRLNKRARLILQSRWQKPQASFYGSFDSWGEAKGAYSFIEQKRSLMSLETLLAPHIESTQARMAAEKVVLLPQDTTSLNYSGLKETTGLGALGEDPGQGLWLHSLLAIRPDGVPLGLVHAECWARPPGSQESESGRNAKSIDEKESMRWLEALHVSARMARRMPQTQLVVLADREGDLYELHDAVQQGPANLHLLVRAQHDRKLECHQKLWEFMASQPVGEQRVLEVPRRRKQKARTATVEVRWSPIVIQSPSVGCKKGWPALKMWAIWVRETNAAEGVEPIEWMLLTDRPLTHAQEAWENVQWYCKRWGIEEWHRALKSGCGAEEREFKSAECLKRSLAFDLIIAWRVLACLKLGRVLPQLPATVIYTHEELEILCRKLKKKDDIRKITVQQANRMTATLGGFKNRTGDGEPGAETLGLGLRRLGDILDGWRMANA